MSSENDYESLVSDAQMKFAGRLAYACTLPGTILCGLALVVYAIVAFFPKARPYLDRVSFRLLVQALISNVLFGIMYVVTPMKDGFICRFGAFFMNLTLTWATFYTTCIAINLQLVLVHRINGKALEKYYVAATLILSGAINVPTYALGQFGYNDQNGICFYSNADEKTRLKWIIATLSFWMIFAAAIETVCSCVVLSWLYRYCRSIDTLTRPVTPSAHSEQSVHGDSEEAHPTLSQATSDIVRRDPKFRSVVLRIVLYPITSLLLNFSTVGLDLHMNIVGVKTPLDYRLLILDLILYGLRPFAYGVLAFMDPSFINAINEIRRSATYRTRLTNLFFIGSKNSRQAQSTFSTDGEVTTIEQENKKSHVVSEASHIATLIREEEPRLSREDEELRKIERQL